MIIYKIVNKLNGKIYIGQTIQPLLKRWNEHCVKSNGCRFLKNAIQLYGKENFTIEQIDTAETMEELNQKEIYWIDLYNSTNKLIGYNLDKGGKRNFPTKSEIEKVRIFRTGKKHSIETIQKMRNRRLNRIPLTEKQKHNHLMAQRKKRLKQLESNDMTFIGKSRKKWVIKVFNKIIAYADTIEQAKIIRDNYLKSIDNEIQSILNYNKGESHE